MSGLLTVDPKKRLTATQLLKMPWVMGKASDRKFGTEHAHRMVVFQARKKMRQGINLVRAVNRFARLLKNLALNDGPVVRRGSLRQKEGEKEGKEKDRDGKDKEKEKEKEAKDQKL